MNLTKVNIISKFKLIVETDDTAIDVIVEKNKLSFYMNGIKKDLEQEQRNEILNYIDKNIDQDEMLYVTVNEDYKNIYSVFPYDLILEMVDGNKDFLQKQLEDVLSVFIEQEHYEKCIIINNLLNNIRK